MQTPTATLDDLTRPGQTNSFDILRLLGAALVLFSHCFALPQGGSAGEPLARLTNAQTTLGSLAVDAFFVISGFLIAQSWLRSAGQIDFLRKRALRIYPGFLIAALFCAIIVGPLAADSARAYLHAVQPLRFLWSALTLSLLALPPVFTHLPLAGEINGSLWTIRYEFWCYLLLAGIGGLGLLRRRGAVAALFVAALLLHAAQEWAFPGIGQGNDHYKVGLLHGVELPLLGNLDRWPRLLAFFLSGTVAYLYRERIPRSAGLAAACVVILALCVHHGLNVALVLCGAYLLLLAAGVPARMGSALTKRADLSYGVYLYAYPFQQLLIQRFGPNIAPWSLFLLAMPVVSGAAWLSWSAIEKPALRLKRRS